MCPGCPARPPPRTRCGRGDRRGGGLRPGLGTPHTARARAGPGSLARPPPAPLRPASTSWVMDLCHHPLWNGRKTVSEYYHCVKNATNCYKKCHVKMLHSVLELPRLTILGSRPCPSPARCTPCSSTRQRSPARRRSHTDPGHLSIPILVLKVKIKCREVRTRHFGATLHGHCQQLQ